MSQRGPVAGGDFPPTAEPELPRAAHQATFDTLAEPLQQRLLDSVALEEVAAVRQVCRRWRQLTDASDRYRRLADARCVPTAARRPTDRHAALRARLADVNLRAGRVVRRMASPQPRGRVSLAWSSDGRRLGATVRHAGNGATSASIFDTVRATALSCLPPARGRELFFSDDVRTLIGTQHSPARLAFACHEDGARVAGRGPPADVAGIGDVDARHPLRPKQRGTGTGRQSPDGHFIAVVERHGEGAEVPHRGPAAVIFYDCQAGVPSGAERLTPDSGQWSPDSRRFAGVAADGRVQVLAPRGGPPQSLVPPPSVFADTPQTVVWWPSSQGLAVQWTDGSARLVDLRDGGPPARQWLAPGTLPCPEEAQIFYSPSGELVAWVDTLHQERVMSVVSESMAAPQPELLRIGTTADSRAVARLATDRGRDVCVAWSPDDEKIAYGTASVSDEAPSKPPLAIGEARTGRILAELGETSHPMTLAWSPDGSMLAWSAWDGVLHVAAFAQTPPEA